MTIKEGALEGAQQSILANQVYTKTQRRLINREALDEFRLSLQQKHLVETKGRA